MKRFLLGLVLFLSLAMPFQGGVYKMRFMEKLDLDLWYSGYNESLFNNQLPRDTRVVWSDVDQTCGETFPRSDGGFLITISPSCNVTRAEALLTLIHEMVHIHQWYTNKAFGAHGPMFEKEMIRIADSGALEGLW